MLPVAHDALLATDQTLWIFERLAAGAYPDWEGRYGWEPLSAHIFVAGLEQTGPPGPRSFLDVGCGIGSKVHMARMLGWSNVAGVEPHLPYLEVARQVCPFAELHLCRGEDFDGYQHFDVVYSYRPFVDDDAEAAFERLIVRRMRPGAFAFFPHGTADGLGEQVAAGLWKVG